MKLHEMDLTKKIRLSNWDSHQYIECNDNCSLFFNQVTQSFGLSPYHIKSDDWEYFEEEKPKIENRVLTFYRYTYFDLGRKEFTQSPWTTEHWPVSLFISFSRNLIEVETKKVAMAIPSKGGIEFKAAE